MGDIFEKRLKEEALRVSEMLKRTFPTSRALDNYSNQIRELNDILNRTRYIIPEPEAIQQMELARQLFIQQTEMFDQSFSDPTRRFIDHLKQLQGIVIPPYIPLSEITALQNITQSLPEFPELMEEFDEEEERDVEAITNESLIIKLDEKRYIKVLRRVNDGGWTYADGSTLLPSDIYVGYSSEWNTILKELEGLLNDPGVEEEDLQHFFEQHPELLKENTYDFIIPQACIVTDERIEEKPWYADFILAPIDQNEFCKVLELKRPQVNHLGTKRSGHQYYYQKFWQALQQLKDYGEAFNQTGTRQRFQEKYEVEVLKPSLHLIVGRKWSSSNTKNMLNLQKDQQIKIDDWDTYLQQLKRKFT